MNLLKAPPTYEMWAYLCNVLFRLEFGLEEYPVTDSSPTSLYPLGSLSVSRLSMFFTKMQRPVCSTINIVSEDSELGIGRNDKKPTSVQCHVIVKVNNHTSSGLLNVKVCPSAVTYVNVSIGSMSSSFLVSYYTFYIITYYSTPVVSSSSSVLPAAVPSSSIPSSITILLSPNSKQNSLNGDLCYRTCNSQTAFLFYYNRFPSVD